MERNRQTQTDRLTSSKHTFCTSNFANRLDGGVGATISPLRSCLEVGRAFGASSSGSRKRWAQVLLREVQTLDTEDGVAAC